MSTYKEIKTTAHRYDIAKLILKDYPGYVPLTCGAYAQIYVKTGTKKILKLAWNDYSYSAYIKYVIANQDNPWLPKITDVKVYKGRTGGIKFMVTVVEMERLKPVTMNTCTMLSELVRRYVAQSYWFHNDMKVAEEEDAKVIKDTLRDRDLWESLLKVTAVLRKMHKRFGWDLHPGNVMLRGMQRQIVITDPLCDR